MEINIKGLNTFIQEDKFIEIRFKKYKVHEIKLKEWICIMNLIQQENFENDLLKITKLISKIILPNFFEYDSLLDYEKLTLFPELIKTFSKKINNNEEGNKEKDNTKVDINMAYLLGKVCKYYNLSLTKVKDLKYKEFIELYNTIDSLEADYLLKLAEINDNHLYLNSQNNKDIYSKTLEKYKKTYEKNGIKIVRGMNLNELKQLKEMLGGK